MKLTENAFAVLGAMPGDDRLVLNEKADEAALLGGEDAEAALNQLMQMNRRISAELSWLPASTADAADSFLAYARALSEGQSAKIPPLDGLGTALAQANALSALFEIWPAEDADMFMGLCRALDRILSQVTAEETLQAINADRMAGGWETIPDVLTLSAPLNDRLRELCAPVGRAVEKMDQHVAAFALRMLYGAGGVDVQGSVAEVIGDAYGMRIHEAADKLRDEFVAYINRLDTAPCITVANLQDLRTLAEKWCALTAPLRMKAGSSRSEAKNMSHSIRNAIVAYVNKYGTVKKSKVFRIPVFNGTKTVTIQYNSQKDSVERALDLNRWLALTFPEQLELQERLKEDEGMLKNILRNEEIMLAKAEAEARFK